MALNFLGTNDETIKLLSCSILMRVFQNEPKTFHSTYSSENILSLCFHEFSLVYK